MTFNEEKGTLVYESSEGFSEGCVYVGDGVGGEAGERYHCKTGDRGVEFVVKRDA